MAPLPVQRRRIFLDNLEMAASIGVHPQEKRALQRVRIDVELSLDPATEPPVDRLSATLDYEALHDAVVQIGRSRHFALQETLARAIYDFCCGLEGVRGARVVTRKLDAYADCVVGYELAGGDLGG